MSIESRLVEHQDIAGLRNIYRQEMNCQIIRRFGPLAAGLDQRIHAARRRSEGRLRVARRRWALVRQADAL